jgi:hypothetical protein
VYQVEWSCSLQFDLYPAYKVFLLNDTTALTFALENFLSWWWSSIPRSWSVWFSLYPAYKFGTDRWATLYHKTWVYRNFGTYGKVLSQVTLMWKIKLLALTFWSLGWSFWWMTDWQLQNDRQDKNNMVTNLRSWEGQKKTPNNFQHRKCIGCAWNIV